MIKLGAFTFSLDDYPSQLPTGGQSLISLKKYPGGQQTVQNFGAFDDEIVLTGTFNYTHALSNANKIDTMWRAGNAVQFVVSGLKTRWVMITEYKPIYYNDYQIDYEIHLQPVTTSSSTTTATRSTNSVSSSSSSGSSKSSSPQRTYIVKKGDCLWKIALKYYGDGSEYTKISSANKLKTTVIQPGEKLVIP